MAHARHADFDGMLDFMIALLIAARRAFGIAHRDELRPGRLDATDATWSSPAAILWHAYAHALAYFAPLLAASFSLRDGRHTYHAEYSRQRRAVSLRLRISVFGYPARRRAPRANTLMIGSLARARARCVSTISVT